MNFMLLLTVLNGTFLFSLYLYVALDIKEKYNLTRVHYNCFDCFNILSKREAIILCEF